MNSELLRNGSGYVDPTAAQAIRNMVCPEKSGLRHSERKC